jgi:Rps23 Pro-64 3,4-dihydroxylase Tpa1-like proline 4-hydroxylase
MWLNQEQTIDSAIRAYRKSLLDASPNYVVIDNLFASAKLDEVVSILHETKSWQAQRHTYSDLYVNNAQWLNASNDERFVSRDVWQREALKSAIDSGNIAQEFLSFLRGVEFMSLLSRIFNVPLTDINVAKPEINTNYFRLSATDFVHQHADDSPGRVVCMLLYLNKEWINKAGGELVFMGSDDKAISIAPTYNRCVLFDPFSKGSEHWVNAVTSGGAHIYRYNVTSWYWSE